MKLSLFLAGLIAFRAAALPAAVPAPGPAPAPVPNPEPEVTERGFAHLEDLSSELAKRQSLSTTRNDLSGPCKPVTVIFARGTSEAGNVGSIAGPPFFNALGARIGYGNVAVQGVDYAASVAGYLEGGDPAGASTLASLTNQAASKCPNTQIVLGGYSQGAQVVHLGVRQISAAVAARVHAVILFGDPDNGQPLQNIPASKVDTFCASGDLICAGLPIVLPPHLSYGANADQAAAFVQARVTV